ncbi:MAG TPA: response regulator transcription factor [Pseudonocardiaceae bacterium]|jgi:DNA-binding NarL/FixJ family response regulator|nr:response regulator transcription factor [Pseudonocardiaceae bacterium]
MTDKPIRVVVVDDQAVVRQGLVLVIGLLPGLVVVGDAVNGQDALRVIEQERPDVVLMDLRMPDMDGIEVTRRIHAQYPDCRVLVLTTFADDQSILAALRAGAGGYLTKNAKAEEISSAISAVMRGEPALDPAVQRRLTELATTDRSAASSAPEPLTPREVEVLRLIAEGLSNTEIAQRLYITEGTVKTHINNLFAKAGLRDRAQAVTYAYRHGLAQVPDES